MKHCSTCKLCVNFYQRGETFTGLFEVECSFIGNREQWRLTEEHLGNADADGKEMFCDEWIEAKK